MIKKTIPESPIEIEIVVTEGEKKSAWDVGTKEATLMTFLCGAGSFLFALKDN